MISSHENPVMQTDQWLTPPEIVKRLGEFDLDPCFSDPRPWDTAKVHFSEFGLQRPWFGRVWLNPPYGPMAADWLEKLANHGRGTALIFARTETEMFFNHVWNKADAVLFIRGRLCFYYPDGKKARGNSGAPSILIAYGAEDAQILKHSTIAGQFLPLK